MPQKALHVAGLGEISVYKRKNSRNLRLTITPHGQVKVSIPYWTPYAVGAAFAKSRADWIKQRQQTHKIPRLNPGALIGKTHHLYFRRVPGLANTRTRVADSVVSVISPLPFEDPSVQAIAYSACERALKLEAEAILPKRLSVLAEQHGYRYRKVRVRKLTSRWGSCSSKNDISLSYFLIQLPWELIDYVIIHELVHTKHLNHGSDFWQAFEKALPATRTRRKQLKNHQPTLILA